MIDFSASSTLIYPVSLVALYLIIILAVAESLNRFTRIDSELTRKIVHIGSGNVILLAWWFNIPRTIIILASVIAAIIALISYFLPILPSVNSVGRKSLGTFFYAISIGVLAALFWQNCPQCTVIGVLTMTWGDGMAAIIGQKFGTHLYQVRGITKSWEGSTAMILVSYLVISLVWGLSLGYSWQVALFACLVAVVATCLETFSLFGIDNLTVPLASGILTYFLMQI